MRPYARLAAALLPLAAGCGHGRQAGVREPTSLPPAPTFRVADMSGREWASEGLKGRTLVVEFWATWCGPCREIAPDLGAFYDRRKGAVTFLSLSLDESREAVASYLSRRPAPYPVAHVGPGAHKDWGVRLLPALVLVKDGKVLARWEGKAGVLEALKTIEQEIL